MTQQSPHDPNLGAIDLQLQGSVMTSNVIAPRVTVNGYPVPTKYGQNLIPMPAGRHRVDVWSQWLRKFGQASIDVDVQPGMATPVFYATPWHQFTTGSIGFEKQKRKGAAVGFTILGLIFVAVFLAFAL